MKSESGFSLAMASRPFVFVFDLYLIWLGQRKQTPAGNNGQFNSQ